jgi:large subunit ribosomal protein L35
MKGGSSHLRRNKPARVKRMYDDKQVIAAVDRPRLSKLIPYGTK